MKNKAWALSQYTFTDRDIILLDTNIWLELFPGPSDSRLFSESPYRDAFKRLKAAKSELVLDPLVLSEYLNTYTRIEYKALFQPKYSNFKQFRKSGDFCSAGQGAVTFAHNMLKIATMCDCSYSTFDVGAALSEFEIGGIDFNDSLIAENCRQNNWKLMTNDGDFIQGGIEVITANIKLIAACAK